MEADDERPSRSALRRTSDGRLGSLNWRRLLAADIRQGTLPGLLIIGVLIGVFILELFHGEIERWGLSRQALREGRWQTFAVHAVTHAGFAHLWMNSAAILGMTVAVRRMTGKGVTGWSLFFALFIGAGIASAAAYLLLHPDDGLPMVGASGAICGFWGVLVRMDGHTGRPRPLRSKTVLLGIRDFGLTNLILFGLLFVVARASNSAGGLAWEAHLGGFMFGLFGAPILFRNISPWEPAATSARDA